MGNKMPGFNISMQEFWEDYRKTTMISEFLSDLTTLISNAKQDYGAVSSSVVNINDKIETYLDRFEQMSVNWSNSIPQRIPTPIYTRRCIASTKKLKQV